MSAINLPTPAPEDSPVDYAAHVLRQLQTRLDLAAVERALTDLNHIVFHGWHLGREAYFCYLLCPGRLRLTNFTYLNALVNNSALAFAVEPHSPNFPILTGLIAPNVTTNAKREYERAGFDLPLLIVPVPVQFVNV